MSEILKTHARQIIDSRGNPTVEVEITSSNNKVSRAAVPSGASTGAHEAHELRDKNKTKYQGKGVEKAVKNVNDIIAPKIKNMSVFDQRKLDLFLKEIDGTDNKSNLGANAILGVSLACAKLAALESNLPFYQYIGGVNAYKLPVPLMNVLNGGAHADNGLDVQEFMIVPVVDNSFSESLRAGCEIFQVLKKILNDKNLLSGIGDEGGFAPILKSNQEALDLLIQSIEKAGYKAGENIFIALDVASTELYKDNRYKWEGELISGEKLGQVYLSWIKSYPIVSIEDAFGEDDWENWSNFNNAYGNKVQLVGDDLFVTNPVRLQRGINEKAANALLVKVNQIGTLSETIDAVKLAQENNFRTIMSHRSGETEDTTISDLAVGLSCQQIKTGSVCRSERTAKYNQLIRIEEHLNVAAKYWGLKAFETKV